MQNTPVALVTGGGRRIGAEISRQLHAAGFNVLIHFLRSKNEAVKLATDFNDQRADSAVVLSADLNDVKQIEQLAMAAEAVWGRVDALINNASSYYPTEFGTVQESQWDDLLASNTKAPFFLSQALAAALTTQKGAIVNIVDIHAQSPLANYSPYTIAKAGNAMLTKSLARELAPDVRVNGVAPGVIIWPEKKAEHSEEEKQRILSQVPLGREGQARDIAKTVCFFVNDAPYITGQILAVDGGRSIFI